MILVPISIAELVDKITILKIKMNYASDKVKLQNIQNEYNQLSSLFNEQNLTENDDDFLDLLKINEKIWHTEDAIRQKEKSKEFDDDFIQFARNIYYLNDDRANVKKKINIKHNSYIIEEKLYDEYK